ncbi:MAG: nodW [Gemmatimonadetes bacterium]|jgi:FixJ family two-component response regulator|nr:nodW [Gemmatimonadota bacterium]
MGDAGPIVFVLDDDISVREALRSLIRSVGLRCETFATAADFVRHPRPDQPACLVLDVQLPGGSGLDLPTQLREGGAELPIIFITGHGTIPMSVRAMKAGALEFLTKPFSERELLDAIQQALGRDREARTLRAEQHTLQEQFGRLTARERDVFSLVVTGRMNKEIAAELGTAEQTIKQHRGRVMQKLGARSVADLVHLAERLAGILPK